MTDAAPTPEQQRIASEGTDAQRLALARDPNISDAVRLLFKRDLPLIAGEAVRTADSDETRLEFAKFATDWVLIAAVRGAKSDATRLNPIFARNSLASVRAAAAEKLESDAHRTQFLEDPSAMVRGAAIRGMKSVEMLKAHLARETAKGVRQTTLERIRFLTANAPQAQLG
jgi:hypothetical protein